MSGGQGHKPHRDVRSRNGVGNAELNMERDRVSDTRPHTSMARFSAWGTASRRGRAMAAGGPARKGTLPIASPPYIIDPVVLDKLPPGWSAGSCVPRLYGVRNALHCAALLAIFVGCAWRSTIRLDAMTLMMPWTRRRMKR